MEERVPSRKFNKIGTMEEVESPHQNHSITFSNSTTSAFLRKIKDHAPTLLISGSILLLLTGLTVTATVLCIIFFSPLILFTSPIWFPIGAFLFVVTAGFMSLCGYGVALVAGLSWIYRYFCGMHPPGSTVGGVGFMTLPLMSRIMQPGAQDRLNKLRALGKVFRRGFF